jgi:hypothetical protein
MTCLALALALGTLGIAAGVVWFLARRAARTLDREWF